jgi:peptidoglycan/LPS O-acetylase OafA/YrhL
VGAQFIAARSPLASSFANIELSGITLTCCGLIGLCIAFTNSRWLSILRSPVLTFFGLISYAFYVIHLFIIQAYDHFSPTPIAGNMVAYGIRLVAILAISVGLSLASRYAIELPALSLRRRVLAHPEPPAETELPILASHADAHAALVE